MKRQLITAAIATFIGFMMACATRYATAPVTAQTSAPQAGAPAETCEWTYLGDRGDPEIGANGRGGTDSDQWAAMSRGGWKLKAINQPAQIYIFERCRPR